MEDLNELAKRLAPYMAKHLMSTTAVWGENPLIVGNNVCQINTLYNTSSGKIVLEDDVFFGHNVCLLTGVHDYTKKGVNRMRSYPRSGRDIIVRRGVWISSNVTVLGPCEIGENSVIAAGSVVTTDVPANCIYGGIPAKFIKNIDFTE